MAGPIWNSRQFGPELPLSPAERRRRIVFGVLVAVGTIVELVTFALVLGQSMRAYAACAPLPGAECSNAPFLTSSELSFFGGSVATAGIGATVALAGIAVLILHLGLPS
jgi:hypothetical protein